MGADHAPLSSLLDPTLESPTDPTSTSDHALVSPPTEPDQAFELGDDEFAALAEFRLALRTYLRFSEMAAQSLGLTGQQYQALLVVRSVPPDREVSVGELARQLLIKHHSAVGLVDRLVEQGLLTRRPSSEDARKVKVQLTAKGARVLSRLVGTHRDELGRVGPRLRQLVMNATRDMR